MPVLYFLKEPPLTLAVLGTITDDLTKEIAKKLPVIKVQAPDGRNMLIVIEKESNIAYIKEINEEQLAKMKERAKEGQEEKRISPPPAGFRVPPSGKHRGGKLKH